jgi:SAM-dependent methyltransferase
MELYCLRPARVLEVGAANGRRLAAIIERYGCRAVAVEPSQKAIEAGRAKFPKVQFMQGNAAEVSLQETFDLVIVNGVFCWVDRSTLLRSVAQIDRLLANGGFLIIGDFYPTNMLKVHYHHLPDHDIYTYKQNYAAIYLASGLYHAVGMITRDHALIELQAEATESNRFGAWLLRKAIDKLYVESALPQ